MELEDKFYWDSDLSEALQDRQRLIDKGYEPYRISIYNLTVNKIYDADSGQLKSV
jgi:hypothetical protein